MIRIATRKSELALWQANFVKQQLQLLDPTLEIELLGMLTTADKMLTTPLNKIGGKGLFVKELEKAMLDHHADLAVHSIKDMPAELPKGLTLGAILPREDSRDAFISNSYSSLFDLPQGAIIGTSSLRRQAQVLVMRPDLSIKPLRGNVGTRLKKLDDGEFDGIVLAAAGLKRLGLEHKISCYLSLDQMLPAAGQGAIGIECRSDDEPILSLITALQDANTRDAILAERTLNAALGGSCQFPIAAFAVVTNDILCLEALVSDYNGKTILRTTKQGQRSLSKEIALDAASDLISQGALALLERINADK